jgi:hypothetical protein
LRADEWRERLAAMRRGLSYASVGLAAAVLVLLVSPGATVAQTISCTEAQPCYVKVDSGGGGFDAKSIAAIGTLAAAFVAAMFALLNEGNKNRLRRKGIARIVADDMRRTQSAIARARFRGRWWADEEELPPRVSTDEDVQRLATALRPNEWATVSSAMGWTDTLRGVRAQRVAEANDQRGDGADNPDHLSVKQRLRVAAKGRIETVRAARVRPQDIHLEGAEPQWLVESWYRLEAARWSLRRLGAPLPLAVALGPLTRLRWRKHGQSGVRQDEMARTRDQAERARIQAMSELSLEPRQLRQIRYRGLRRWQVWEQSNPGWWPRLRRWWHAIREL